MVTSIRFKILNIYQSLGEFTEWQLATLSMMRLRKRCSKKEIERQENICKQMVEACMKFKVIPQLDTPRLMEAVKAALRV